MKRLTYTFLTLTLVTILSSTAFAGHIAGGRASGHIAGGRSATAVNPDSVAIATNETIATFGFESKLPGAFASLIRMLLGASTLF